MLILYSGIFIAIAGVSCLPMVRSKAAKPWWWWAVVGGAIAFPLTMQIQPPIQLAYAKQVIPFIKDILPVEVYSIPSVWISGLVQEALKIIPILLIMKVWHLKLRDTVAAGAGAGVGFGVTEAIMLVAIPLAAQSGFATGAVIERLVAIPFHVLASALVALGLALRKGWQYYLLAATAHGLLNYSVVLVGMWYLDTNGMLIWCLAIDLLMAALLWKLMRGARLYA